MPRSKAQSCHPDVLAKSRRQRTMLGRIVKRDHAIEMRSAFRNVSRIQQGMPIRRCPIMSGTVAPCFSASARNCAASSRTMSPLNATVRDPEAVENREQQQRVFGRLSERFGLLDQQTCPFRRRLGFRCGIPLNG